MKHRDARCYVIYAQRLIYDLKGLLLVASCTNSLAKRLRFLFWPVQLCATDVSEIFFEHHNCSPQINSFIFISLLFVRYYCNACVVLQLLVLQPAIAQQEDEPPSVKELLMDPYIIVAAGQWLARFKIKITLHVIQKENN